MNITINTIEFAGKKISQFGEVFLVAETGTTCNGDLKSALKLIDGAAAAGMDAIKFQMINPDEFMSDKTTVYKYDWGKGDANQENMFEMFQKLRFTRQEWQAIAKHCDNVGLPWFATVDYLDGVDMAEDLGVCAMKIGSWDIWNHRLIRKIAQKNKPVVVDLGPAYLGEITRLIDIISNECSNRNIVLLHCTHSKTDEQVNLRTIPYLNSVFHLPVGYSADTRDSFPDVVSLGMGCSMLEKRVTLDTGFAAHHHNKALEPLELKDWVQTIRRGEAMRGKLGVFPSDEDIRLRGEFFLSITSSRDIKAGESIAECDLSFKRPGHGLHPDLCHFVAGRIAKVDIPQNTQITLDMV